MQAFLTIVIIRKLVFTISVKPEFKYNAHIYSFFSLNLLLDKVLPIFSCDCSFYFFHIYIIFFSILVLRLLKSAETCTYLY